jgi:hypothetical protein
MRAVAVAREVSADPSTFPPMAGQDAILSPRWLASLRSEEPPPRQPCRLERDGKAHALSSPVIWSFEFDDQSATTSFRQRRYCTTKR